jgi:NADPH2:quinone reductase
MRAVTYRRFGLAKDVLELGEHPEARPAEGEVRVALTYSAVNPSDVKRRASARPGIDGSAFDRVCPHSDGAGVIEAVGDGVDPTRLGERVWIWNGHWQRTWGTAAQKITLPAAQAVPLPDTVSFETGASLGIPGLTAAHCVLGDGPVTGKCVLVHGGAGNVGFLAVQLAKWSGAKVIATASPRDFGRCRGAGADAVIDYRSDQLATEILAAANGQPVDRIVEVEFGLNIDTDVEVIAPNGVISVYGSQKEQTPTLPFYPLLFKAVTVEFALIYILADAPRRKAIDNLHAALTEGALTCPVDRVFPLSQTALAHESVERGARSGATLIDVNDG